MRRADNGLRAEMIKRLKPHGFLCDPVESGAVTSGLPDLTWGHAGERKTGWCECKATDGWAVTFRPHQLGWISRRAGSQGDRVAVAVRARGLGSGLGRDDALWLVAGSHASLLAEHGLRILYEQHGEGVLGRWGGPPRAWDWHAVAAALLV